MHASNKAFAKAESELASQPSGTFIRIEVNGQACNPFYSLTFDRMFARTDRKIFTHGIVAIVADERDAAFLKEAILDYVTTKEGEGFAVINLEQLPACGCAQTHTL